MESGTFNNIRKIGNFVIKILKETDDISKQIMEEMNSRSVNEYVKDINSVGIKTAKVFAMLKIRSVSIMVQEYISGITVQDVLLSEEISVKDKLKIFKQFLSLYQNAQKNKNLCLDWNMKNFILSGEDIYYIDFVPCLYRDKILQSTAENLLQYRESYLEQKIQIAGILGYAMMPFLKSSSLENSKIVYEKMKAYFREIVSISFEPDDLIGEHVYLYKLKQIEMYLNSMITYEEMISNIKGYSMEKVSRRVREK